MPSFGKSLTFLPLVCAGILFVFPGIFSTPVNNTLPENNLTISLSGPTSAEINNEQENALDGNDLSYDALITSDFSDSSNNSRSDNDIYYNGTDPTDNLTTFEYQPFPTMGNDTEKECEDCFENKLIRYAGHSTIIVTVFLLCILVFTIAYVTYRNILSMVP